MRADTLSHAAHAPLPRTLLMVLGLIAPLLIYLGTVQSMVGIWDSSETFTHQYMILPISLWLIWRDRRRLQQMTAQPFPPALIVLLLCGFGWLLGTLADVQVVRQYSFVAIVIASAVALLGARISRAIAFPLFFLLLAVPFGEIFIEPLIGITADFTVNALQLTGIPVLREGNTFAIPSGRWSVVEACSGVRYLIASVTLGCLYAHITYRSWKRKAAFLLVSMVVPVIANGLRAYMIVMIGHLSGMRLAVGVDHLIYGWLFFGLVTFIMFWIGGRWIDKPLNDPHAAIVQSNDRQAPGGTGKYFLFLLLTLACTGIWPVYAWYMDRIDTVSTPISLSPAGQAGLWHNSPAFSNWQPAFSPASAEITRFYSNGAQPAQQVGLSLRYYRDQHQGATLVSSVNRILPEKNSPWTRLTNTVHTVELPGRQLAVREESIQGAGGSLLIWRWYWIDRRFVENDYLAKLYQTRSRLTMHGDDGAAVFVFAPYSDKPEQARQTLQAYLTDNLGAIEAMLNANGKH
jgi:exosortase A